MSKFHKYIYIALFIFTIQLLFINESFGKIVAVVSKLEGKAFYSSKGKTYPLKQGTHIPAQAEVFTEMGAQVSINDYYDHVYHVSGGAHIVVYSNLVELQEGYLWVKSLAYDELKGPFSVTTPNAVIENKKGEGIVSFDVYTGKTQLLSIRGNFEFRNSLMENLGINLSEGQFSFIHNEHEKGHPRRATPIGYASYKKVTGLFSGIQPFKDEEKVIRRTFLSTNPPPKQTVVKNATKKVEKDSSSSVFDEALQDKKRGDIQVLKMREPASIKKNQKNVINFYKQKIQELSKPKARKRWTPDYKMKSSVPVKVFGAASKQRTPASVKKKEVHYKSLKPGKSVKKQVVVKKKRAPASVGGMLPKIKTNAFESELLRQYKSQMRHEKEVNELIDRLESVNMDYQKEY